MSTQAWSGEAEASGDPHSDRTNCDLCKLPILQPTPYGKPVLNPAIRHKYGSAARVEISFTTGEQESDWGAGEVTSFTVCPDCFEHKLIDWFAAQGAVPKVRSWEN